LSTGVTLTKSAIDLGIVTSNGQAMLAFYRDTLGFRHDGDTPALGNGLVHRLWCGESMIKIVVPGDAPPAHAVPGGIVAATGYRYWTISVSNLTAMVESCRTAGYRIAWEPREIRSGVTIAMIEDPDGNWVELLQHG
jgi:catechol 2,3-dioxygenase-like lactoylglutathione lyase family enzyme